MATATAAIYARGSTHQQEYGPLLDSQIAVVSRLRDLPATLRKTSWRGTFRDTSAKKSEFRYRIEASRAERR